MTIARDIHSYLGDAWSSVPQFADISSYAVDVIATLHKGTDAVIRDVSRIPLSYPGVCRLYADVAVELYHSAVSTSTGEAEMVPSWESLATDAADIILDDTESEELGATRNRACRGYPIKLPEYAPKDINFIMLSPVSHEGFVLVRSYDFWIDGDTLFIAEGCNVPDDFGLTPSDISDDNGVLKAYIHLIGVFNTDHLGYRKTDWRVPAHNYSLLDLRNDEAAIYGGAVAQQEGIVRSIREYGDSLLIITDKEALKCSKNIPVHVKTGDRVDTGDMLAGRKFVYTAYGLTPNTAVIELQTRIGTFNISRQLYKTPVVVTESGILRFVRQLDIEDGCVEVSLPAGETPLLFIPVVSDSITPEAEAYYLAVCNRVCDLGYKGTREMYLNEIDAESAAICTHIKWSDTSGAVHYCTIPQHTNMLEVVCSLNEHRTIFIDATDESAYDTMRKRLYDRADRGLCIYKMYINGADNGIQE